MKRHWQAVCASVFAFFLSGPLSGWDVPLAEYKVGRPCKEITGGHVPPRKPMKWPDQRYLEVLPATAVSH